MNGDIVDTSDPEEQEELRAPLRGVGHKLNGADPDQSWLSESPPRKRVKLDIETPHAVFDQQTFPLHSTTSPKDSLNMLGSTSQPRSPVFVHDGSQDPLLLVSSDPLFPPSSRPRSVSPLSPAYDDSGPSTQHKDERRGVSTKSSRSISPKLGSSSEFRLLSEEHNYGTRDQLPSTTPPLCSRPGSPITTQSSSPLSAMQPLFSPQPSISGVEVSYSDSCGSDQMDVGDQRVQLNDPEDANTSRYSLRRRQAVQIAPYSVDKFKYKQALRHNPEAIIRVRSPERNRQCPLGRYEDDEAHNESQENTVYIGSPINQEQFQSESRNSGPGPENVSYPEILQSSSETDEDNETKAISKEAQIAYKARIAREARQKRKGAVASRKTRAFPLTNATEDTIAEDTSDLTNPIDRYGGLDGDASYATPTSFAPNLPSPRHGDILEDDREVERDTERDTASASEAENSDDSYDLQSEVASPSSRSVIDKRRMKMLGHMMPKSMVKQMLYQENSTGRPKQRRQQSEALSSEGEEDLPLGRTRIRKGINLLPTQQIRGDSESSDDAERSDETQDLDPEIITRSSILFSQHQIEEDHEVLSISDSGSETEYSSSDGDVVDEDIQVYLREEDTGSESMENDNLIIRMLAHTSMIRKSSDKRTRSRKRVAGNKRPRKRKYATDIITHEARKYGKGRQIPLDFDRHDRDQSRGDGNGFRPKSPRFPRANRRYTPSTPRTTGQPTARNRQNRKAGHRQAGQNTNGIYTFSNQGRTRIVSSRNEGHPIVFHTELEAPGARFPHDWANAFRPFDSRNSKLATSNIVDLSTSMERREKIVPMKTSNGFAYDGIKSRRQKVVVDMGIHVLPSGISFSPDTFIGKGWLHELIGVPSTSASPPEPTSCHLCGHILRPDMGCEIFLNKLQSICEDLLEFSTGLPEVEHTEQRNEWNVIIRTACQLVSWYRETGSDNQRQQLIEKIEICAQNIVNRIRDFNFESKSLDIAILQLDWFTVELLARAHSTSQSAVASTIFHESLLLLIGHLIELDAHSALVAMTFGNTLDSSTVLQRSAELWVCLLHLVGSYQNGEKSRRGNISFWSLLLASLQAREEREERSVLEGSEMVWKAIFSLCALSQFSVHGMTTSQPRLPGSWAVVLFAMNKVRLAADPAMDQKLPTAHLTRRDKYIRILLFRCFQLCDKWQWQLEDASELFNELGEVFRSRKFANLRHERPDYPDFMLHREWSHLLQHEGEDSAFILFLKLVVRAIKAGQGAITPPKFKKLLSLAIPVGSLPFSKEIPPSKQELSMLFNRLSAIAIGIYLDPSSYKTRISHARTYVAFVNADLETRVAVIRGMVNLAILMKKIDLPLDATTEWIAEIASTFSAELKRISLSNRGGTRTENEGKNSQLTPQDGLHICIQILLLSVRRILEHDNHEYPDPALIWSIKELLINPRESKTICQIRKLIEVLHKARNAALHSSELQFIHNDNAESSTSEGKEKNLCSAIEKTHLVWFCWKNLRKQIQELKDQTLTISRAKALDQWIYCWLGCIDILVRNGDTRWSSFLYLPKNLDIKNDVIRRRVDLGVANHLLRIYPMIYTTYTDMFLEVFFESLAVDEPTIEHEYVSLLLSVDGLQHPLLRELTSFRELNQPQCNISSIEFSTLRLPVLKVVLTGLNNALEHQNGAGSDPDVQKYIGYCIKCFSTIRSVFSHLERGSNARTTYLRWCKQVFGWLQGLGHILSHQKLADLLHWGRSLETLS